MLSTIDQSGIAAKGVGAANMHTGAVLQVVSVTKTDSFVTSSTSWVDWFSVAITPTSATSKVYITLNSMVSNSGDNSFQFVRLLRNGTQIALGDAVGLGTRCWINGALGSGAPSFTTGKSLAGSFLDSPGTTSSVTYMVQVIRTANGSACFGRAYDQTDSNRASIPSVLTAQEIAG